MTDWRVSAWLAGAGAHRRKLSATAAALALHLAILMLFLTTRHGPAGARGEFVRGIGDDGPGTAITVSLILAGNFAPTEGHATPSTASDPLQRLLNAIDANRGAVSNSEAKEEPQSLRTLFNVADRRLIEGSGGTAGSKAAVQSFAEAGASGDIFALLEPCWRRALDASRVPVSMELSLNRDGYADRAPKILQVGAGSREDQRIATERALQAVSACTPFRRPASRRGGVFRVNFGLSQFNNPE